MFSQRLTRPIAIAATAIALAGGVLRHRQRNSQHGLRHRDNSVVHLGNLSTKRPRQGAIQRSVWTGRGRINRRGRATSPLRASNCRRRLVRK